MIFKCKGKAPMRLLKCFLTACLVLCIVAGPTMAAPSAGTANPQTSNTSSGAAAGGQASSQSGEASFKQMTLAQAQAEKRTGFVRCVDGLFYLEQGNICRKVWKNADGKKYYFTSSGAAACGKSVRINQKYYVFSPDGALSEGKTMHVLKMEDGTLYLVKKKRAGESERLAEIQKEESLDI